MEKASRQHSARRASMICWPAASSYFALSFRSSCSGNCNGCPAMTNLARCFSEETRLQSPIYRVEVEGDCVACGVARSPDYTYSTGKQLQRTRYSEFATKNSMW